MLAISPELSVQRPARGTIAAAVRERGEDMVAAATAWQRCLERRCAGADVEDGLDRAVASSLPRGGIEALPAGGIRLVAGTEPLGDCDALPAEILIGWTDALPSRGGNDSGGSASDCNAPDSYDRLIVDLLEAGFRPLAEKAGTAEARYRIVRARRDGYRLRSYRPGDEAAILDLFRDCFGSGQGLRQWRWRYLDNPRGGPRISLAFSPGGELVCQYCAYPVRWRGLPASCPPDGHQVGDTMTRRSARAVGRGPTSLLARAARHFHLRHCQGRVAFNYGFNTGNILEFSNRFLGVRQVEDVPCRELPAGARLGRRFRRPRQVELRTITKKAEIDDRFDALVERVQGRYGTLVERSAEYLRWRYLDCPADSRSNARPTLIGAWRNGRLAGWVAAARLPERVVWGDALIDPDELPALRALVERIREPDRPVVGWFSDRPRWLSRELDRLGFLRQREPQGLVTGLTPFACENADELLRQQGYYTMADSDLF